MVDEETGDKFARAVGAKGLPADHKTDWVVKAISQELKAWGHSGGDSGKIIIKIDGETSIKAVRNAVAKYHGGVVIPEQSARGQSQSNGTIEGAVRLTQEFTRVLKLQMEDQAQVQIKPEWNITTWMIRWSAMLISRFLVGKDGKQHTKGGEEEHAKCK